MSSTRYYWQDASQVGDEPARDPRDEPLYVISVAADLAGMHPQTLRAYERKGLIEPHRTEGNTRRYSQRDVERLKLIQHLTQEEGLNLAGVRMVIRLLAEVDLLRSRNKELEERLRLLAEQLRDDVEAAHRSHRYDVVPRQRSDVEPHPAYPTRRRRSS